MEGGIYITFFEPGEPFERELPPVGPLDHVVARHGRLVADRRHADHAHHAGDDVVKALHAEIELQRALGDEPGGPVRSEMRVTAPDGVFLRFASFDARAAAADERGPFAVVRISSALVEADGERLATRAPGEPPSWALANGETYADVALRSSTTAYHPRVPAPAVTPRPAPAGVETVRPPVEVAAPPTAEAAPVTETSTDVSEYGIYRRTQRRQAEVYSPPGSHGAITEGSYTPPQPTHVAERAYERPEPTPASAPATPTASLRSRIQAGAAPTRRLDGPLEETPPPTRDYSSYRAQRATDRVMIGENETRQFDMRAVLWRWRIAIIGVLVVAAAAYALTVALGTGGDKPQVVGLNQQFSSAHWTYVVNATQRAPSAGRSSARGVYYAVRLNVTNRGSEDARLQPSDFVLIDANGVQHSPESLAGGAYFAQSNPQSPFVWPDAFPPGRTTSVALVFDIDPTLPKGMTLKVVELPNVTVTLD